MQKQMCNVCTYVPHVQTMHISNLVLTIGILHDNQYMYLKDLRTSRLMHRVHAMTIRYRTFSGTCTRVKLKCGKLNNFVVCHVANLFTYFTKEHFTKGSLSPGK